jgi:DNA-binding NarL/FixJ family response regulator
VEAAGPEALQPGSTTSDDRNLRIFLIDDSALVHAGLEHTLQSHPDIKLAGHARDDGAALEACLDSTLDALVISSLCRSIDVPHLIQRVAHLHEHGAGRVLLLTNDIGDSVCLTAGKLGVGGIVLTWEPPRILVSALRVVAHGYAVSASGDRSPHGPQGQQAGTPATRRDALDLLTSRERDVLKLMARGLKNSEIAGELVVSESTVKTHVQNLLTKLGIRNRASAVAIAYELGVTRIGAPAGQVGRVHADAPGILGPGRCGR